MYSEDDLIPLSYLSQWYFCHRRAGLMLLEQQWQDNVHTAEGSVLHERVHSNGSESRKTIVVLRGAAIRSLELGISGKADCIELHRQENGAKVPWLDGEWLICPVEYKHGRRRDELEYRVQLCAQAMCLEEMFGCHIEYGQVYFGSDRRRVRVDLDEELRCLVRDGAKALFHLLATGVTPSARVGPKCRECSLKEICFTRILGKPVKGYLDKLLHEAHGDGG